MPCFLLSLRDAANAPDILERLLRYSQVTQEKEKASHHEIELKKRIDEV
jgi:hypothetical protein